MSGRLGITPFAHRRLPHLLGLMIANWLALECMPITAASIRPGDLLVTDFIDAVVRQYSPDGTLGTTFRGTGEKWEGVGITPAGMVVVTRREPAPGINVFDATGREISSFPTPTLRPFGASDLSVFADGTIAINDQTDTQIELYSPEGSYLSTIELPGSAWGSSVSRDDTLWVTWQGGNRLYQVTKSGNVLADFHLSFKPGDVIVDRFGGSLWISGNVDGRVYHVDPNNGSVIDSFPTPLAGSFNALGMSLRGHLIAASDSSSSVIRYYSRTGQQLNSQVLRSSRGTLFMDVVDEPNGWSLAAADLDNDRDLDATDIDLVSALLREDVPTEIDITGDGQLNQDDRLALIETLLSTNFGDADLNMRVEFNDFLLFTEHFGSKGGWENGDFSGDGRVAFDDFLLLSSNFLSSDTSATALRPIPEPSGILALIVGTISICNGLRGKQRRKAT